MRDLLLKLKRDEDGISALEYAILVGVLIVAIAGGVAAFKGHIDTLFDAAEQAIGEATE